MSVYVPEDVLVDVLARLPIEIIVRCTLVCKSWFSLITSPNFISHHLNRIISNNKGHLLIRYRTDKPRQEYCSLRFDDNNTFDEYKSFDFPFTRLHSYFDIVGSCNGLICLSDDQFRYNVRMYLWNPCIRKVLAIPRPNVTFCSHGSFDHALGFGFDSVSNDFKVVRIVHLASVMVPSEVEVYTLKSGCWKSISDEALPYIVDMRSRQAYVDGAAHWLAYTPTGEDDFRNLIVLFDMSSEVFREMPVPKSVHRFDDWMGNTSLVAFRESISLIELWVCGYDPYCTVWVMKDYGVAESWSKQFRLDLNGGLQKPLGLRRNGEVIMTSKEGYLVSVDPERRRIMDLEIHVSTYMYYQSFFYVGTHMESLVLLDKGADFHDTFISDRFCDRRRIKRERRNLQEKKGWCRKGIKIRTLVKVQKRK
ncbi:F-box protein At3g07870-like [Actinidia eriantha]|uniref:F-box protein At3g07870-like n=1 Tax=Actinidia eriantha TaxID=165200 RepID=UPI00258EE45F|nr:F-box protein At3g07870-like [Actinidia eriantha]